MSERGLRLIGVGLPRTGTKSLQAALETLLDGPCYHMHEVFDNPGHVDVWRHALRGKPPDWHVFLDRYVAAVDWPVSAFWPELIEAYPTAVVLLSTRSDGQAWWQSASPTILQAARQRQPEEYRAWQEFFLELLQRRFTPDWDERALAIAAYERHNQAVRVALRGPRLVEWQAADGWEPICRALALPVPEEPFPHLNPRAEWAAEGS